MVKVNFKKRKICVRGEINKRIAQVVIKALRTLDNKADKPILFYIESGGGQIAPALDIYHACHNIKSIVETIGCKNVSSAALLVLQGGNKRYATPKCKFGFHQSCAEFKKDTKLNSVQLINIAHQVLRQDIMQIYILSYNTDNSDKISKLFDYDAIISSKKALKLNLIDGIVKSNSKGF